MKLSMFYGFWISFTNYQFYSFALFSISLFFFSFFFFGGSWVGTQGLALARQVLPLEPLHQFIVLFRWFEASFVFQYYQFRVFSFVIYFLAL